MTSDEQKEAISHNRDEMNCKHYKTWIIDSALGGSEKQNTASQAELQRHLAACPDCREAFERERRLAARIDDTLKRSLAAEPSPDFASHLAARVQQEVARSSGRPGISFWPISRSPQWIAVAIVCAIVLAAGVIWKTRRMTFSRSRIVAVETAEKPRTENMAYSGLEAKKSPRSIRGRLTVATPPSKAKVSVQATTKGANRPHGMRTNGRAKPQTPQVLVPKDEMALVLQLYYGARTGVIDGASLVATPPGFKREPDGSLVSAPIEIKPIVIARLGAVLGPADEP